MQRPRDRLAVTPATGRQLVALHAAFTEAGYRRRWDRPARLADAAGVLGLDELGSFRELSMAQAGRLFAALRNGELPPAVTAPGRSAAVPAVPAAPVPAASTVTAAAVAVLAVMWLAVSVWQRREALAAVLRPGNAPAPARSPR